MTADALQIGKRAKRAAGSLATLDTECKNRVLLDLADRLCAESGAIIKANDADMRAARSRGLPGAKLKRLVVDDTTVAQMSDGLRQVVQLPDPVGAVTRNYTTPGGLHVRKIRCPLGVIMMIYEARPNVTIDAFSLCFKAGNACILKGGREAGETNRRLADCVFSVLDRHGLDQSCLHQVTSSDRSLLMEMLKLERYVDLVIPRGGTDLIRFVHENSHIPTVQHFHGVCHIYVDDSADLQKSVRLCVEAKTSAPATCNAAEAILVHEAIAPSFIPDLVDGYRGSGVEVRGDEAVASLADGVVPAGDDDWGREFLDLVVAVRIVPDMDAAIGHIETFGSDHTDVILTTSAERAEHFTRRVQSSCTLVNASSRFNDGFQLGLGAEIGISTSKIHAFGPMGLEELTTQRFVVQGDWQSR